MFLFLFAGVFAFTVMLCMSVLRLCASVCTLNISVNMLGASVCPLNASAWPSNPPIRFPMLFTIMYFSLCNSPATFQKMMNEIFHDMLDVCVVYIDDLMIFMEKDSQEKHDRVMLQVLRRLCDNDLFVKPEKCHF